MAISDPYQRNVIDAEIWAADHRGALEQVYEAFLRAGEWPLVDELQRELSRAGEIVDLIGELRAMPASLGVAQPDGTVSLSLRALAELPEAAPLLGDYMKVIRLGVERFRGPEDEPRVSDQDLAGLGVERASSKPVSVLILTEGWPFGGGSGSAEGPWERIVSVEFRHLLAAEGIEDFLRVQTELRYGAPPPRRESSGGDRAPAIELPEIREVRTRAPGPAEQTPAERDGETGQIARGGLSPRVLMRLVFKVIARLEKDGYFVEAFLEGEWMQRSPNGETVAAAPRVEDPEEWLMLNLGVEGLWPFLKDPEILAEGGAVGSPFEDRALLLDTLGLLYREAVSAPAFAEGSFEGFYMRRAAQERLIEEIAPILERLEPQMEMRSDGEIVPKAALGLEALGDRPLPDSEAADDVRSKVGDAVRSFRDPRASANDQLSALNELAGILERLRADGRLAGALSANDEGPLFTIANKYGIRHDNKNQKRDYGPAFREWIFHAYLAAIRLALRLSDGDNSDPPAEGT